MNLKWNNEYKTDSHCVMFVLVLMYSKICFIQSRNKRNDSESELRMIVHQSQAGCIIGRQGFKVKELREVRNSLF